jgi:hypothetical protein
MENLEEKLLQMSKKVANKLPEEFLSNTSKAIKELVNSNSIQGLSVGENAPTFTLPDATGVNVNLSEVLNNGPVVLSFYRGSW